MLATPCEAALLRAHAQLRPIAPAPSSSPQRSEKALGGASATAPPSSGSSTPAAVSGSGGGGGGESCLRVHWVAVFQALRAGASIGGSSGGARASWSRNAALATQHAQRTHGVAWEPPWSLWPGLGSRAW
jgi:hypothetical protein